MSEKIVGKKHTYESAMDAIKRKGLAVREVGVSQMSFVDIDDTRDGYVGNGTLGVLDYLAKKHKIHYGRIIRDDSGRVVRVETIQ